MSIPPSYNELFEIGKTAVSTERSELTFDPGDLSEIFVASSTAQADSCVQYTTSSIRGLFLDTAFGDDLSRLADDRGVPRYFATNSFGTITLTRASLSAGAGVIEAGLVVATERDDTGADVEYLTLYEATLAADAYSITINASSIEKGKATNTAPDTITRIVSPIFDSTLEVSNSTFAGGADEEGDEALRERVRGFASTQRRGTLGALEYGAKTIAGVAFAVADDSAETGIVSLYIADQEGGSSAPLITAVQNEIVNWRAGGVIVNTFGATTLNIAPLELSLITRPGIDRNTLVANIKTSIVARVERLRIGEPLSKAVVLSAALSVDLNNILDADTDSIPALTTPLPNQKIRINAEDIVVL